ncbi:urease accessory protein UreD [Sediminimonas qiaohouensis]|uniref:urease accessory protein UreD n=1 Tax=Sediminimonas qiaohouensis TaxID=552061 RepID=UPI000416D306|nr:urease accessory protein UreD [Sediminimonas qiaohouensis]
MTPDIAPDAPRAPRPQRTRGRLHVGAARRARTTRLAALDQSGALKSVFPRAHDRLEAIMVNTAGGITGGDRLSVSATTGPGATLCLTTQAAERAYRAEGPVPGRVETRLDVATGATLFWLPQELILYDGCALERRLTAALDPAARLLFAEPVLFGRAAMGETLRTGLFRDRVSITRGGRQIYRDGLDLSGAITDRLARPSVADGAAAMCSLVYAAPEAQAELAPLRALLPMSGGASLLAPDLLIMRVVAADGHALRQTLLPVLDRLTGDSLPRSWRL